MPKTSGDQARAGGKDGQVRCVYGQEKRTMRLADEKSTSRLRVPRIGDAAPLFEARDINGRNMSLAEHPKPLSLVFMRHLA